MSKHARKYADCYDLQYIGWNTPKGKGLEHLIQKHRFFPITVLRDLKSRHSNLLFRSKIFTLNELIDTDTDLIKEKTGISSRKIREYKEHARMCLSQ